VPHCALWPEQCRGVTYARQQLVIEQEPHCTLRVSRWDHSRQGKGRISATPPDGTGETSNKDTGARLALP
jgi:hypothetical protein